MITKNQINQINKRVAKLDDKQLKAAYDSAFYFMYALCKKSNSGDPFSYARSREILIANTLGHKICSTYSGCDGISSNGKQCEYKSTINSTIKATYSGIMRQNTWKEQVKYIRQEKIGKYDHYFVRFKGRYIAEIYSMSAKTLIKLIMPSIKKQFYSKRLTISKRTGKKVSKRDARISVSLTKNQIYKYGTRKTIK